MVHCSEIPGRRPWGTQGVEPHGYGGGPCVALSRLEVRDDFQAAAGVGEPGVARGRCAVVADGVALAAVGDAAAEVTQIVLCPGVDAGSGEVGSGERGTGSLIAGVVVGRAHV